MTLDMRSAITVVLVVLVLGGGTKAQQQQQRQFSNPTYDKPGTYTPEQFDEIAKVLEKTKDNGSFDKNSIPDSPLQLVRPDHQHKKLVIVEENLKYLYQINQPVVTISVVGKFHSGKSFLMNQIMAKTNGFGIGSKVTPETMGIWIWGQPIHVENPNGPSKWILLLDTEGFAANNVSENYDAKIFAVSTLLSSKLLYNSVKIIDQSDIDYLELLARRTQLFALKAHMTPQKDWAGEFSSQLLEFPSLIWVVQDFVQDIGDQSCRQWLLHLLSSHTREAEFYEISLKDIFPSVDCHTLFIPSASRKHLMDLSKTRDADLTAEYRSDRDQLIEKIKSNIEPKLKNDKPFTGTEIVLLLRILVNAANAGSLKDIPNRWDAFLDTLQKSSIEDCFKFYQSHMNNLLVEQYHDEPINCKELEKWNHVSSEKAFKLLEHLLQGLNKSLNISLPELSDLIMRYYTAVDEHNRQKIHLKLSNTEKSYELKVVDHFLSIKLPILTVDLRQNADKLSEKFASQFVKQFEQLVDQSNMTKYLDMLKKSVRLNLDSTMLRNNQKLDQFFENITSTLLEESFSEISINIVNPLNHKAFESLVQKSEKLIIDSFDRKVGQYVSETIIYNDKRSKLRLMLIEKANLLRKDNEKAVQNYLIKQTERLLNDFDQITKANQKSFPMDFDQLRNILVTEMGKFKEVFGEDFIGYQDYGVYLLVRDDFRSQLITISERRKEENFQAYKREVETPLKMAKKAIMLSGSMYGTLFSYKRFISKMCLLHLENGNARKWSQQLKMDIIESFMKEDQDLSREIQARKGLWSRLVGFFQWILSFIM